MHDRKYIWINDIRRLPLQSVFRQNRENRQNRKICSFPYIRQPKPIFRMQSTPYGEQQDYGETTQRRNSPSPKLLQVSKGVAGGQRHDSRPFIIEWSVATLLAATRRSDCWLKENQNDIPKCGESGPKTAGSRLTTQWKTIHAGLISSSLGGRVLRGGKACDVYSLVLWSP
jgi:hypothetical protein